MTVIKERNKGVRAHGPFYGSVDDRQIQMEILAVEQTTSSLDGIVKTQYFNWADTAGDQYFADEGEDYGR